MIRTISFSVIALLIASVLSCSTESTPAYTLTITASPSEGGMITPDTGTFEEGEAVSLQAIPAAGWVFVRWEQDLSSTLNPMNITMNHDYTVVGVFEQRMYALTINVEGQGTVTETVVQQKNTDYVEGTVVKLEAVPAEKWSFSHWKGDLSGSVKTAEITVDESKEIMAVFTDSPNGTTTEIVEVYNPATGKTWMDRNLGARRAATSVTDSEARGDLYQWGRPADGHQKRNSDTTSTLSSSDLPGHGNFILSSSSPYDWRSPQNDNLWQVVNSLNDPCPDGYRLPTDAEWEAERQSWNANNRDGAFSSPLKLPVAGHRSSSGLLFSVNSIGYYWSSTVSNENSRFLLFHGTHASMYSNRRTRGASIRCIRN